MSAARLFDALAARKPGDIVFRCANQDWDAPAVLDAVGSLSRRLAGCRVLAVLADNGPAWAMADLAALQAGVAHMPLPSFFTAAQMAHALGVSAAAALLTDQPERIEALALGFSRAGEWNGLAVLRREARAANLPEGTAKVSFTSGSTGTPRGVCLGAAGLVDTASALAARLDDLPIARHLAVLPLALLLENIAGIYAPVLRGAAVHLPSLQSLGWRGMSGFHPGALQRTVCASRANSLILVPELLKAWTIHLAESAQHAPVDAVFVAVGGARVDQRLLQRAREQGLPAYQGYGLTECGSVVSLNRPGDDGDGVGRPLAHAGVRVDGGGELRIATQAFLGYLDGAPGDAPTEGAGEFVTGDLGNFDGNGHLHLSGRRTNLLITSYGRNIAPEWVEAALLAQPAVAQAVVAGDGRPWLAAVLVASPGAGAAELEVAVSRANESLPDYARIGGWVAAAPFSLENRQATGNGRPIRASILDQYAAALAALYHAEESFHVVP